MATDNDNTKYKKEVQRLQLMLARLMYENLAEFKKLENPRPFPYSDPQSQAYAKVALYAFSEFTDDEIDAVLNFEGSLDV